MEREREKKPFVPPEPAPPVEAREDVRAAASPVRCPFCHADVRPEARDWVACRACLARHHQGCWKESSACASCGARESIGGPGSRRWRRWLAAASCLAVVAVALVGPRLYREDAFAANQARFEVVPTFVVKPGPARWGRMKESGVIDMVTRSIYARLSADHLGTIDPGYKQVSEDPRAGTLIVSLSPRLAPDVRDALHDVLVPEGRIAFAIVGDAGEVELPVRGRATKLRATFDPILDAHTLISSTERLERGGRPVLGIKVNAQSLGSWRSKNPGKKIAVVVGDEVAAIWDLTLEDLLEPLVVDGVDKPFTKAEVWAIGVARRGTCPYPGPVTVETVRH